MLGLMNNSILDKSFKEHISSGGPGANMQSSVEMIHLAGDRPPGERGSYLKGHRGLERKKMKEGNYFCKPDLNFEAPLSLQSHPFEHIPLLDPYLLNFNDNDIK